MPQINAEAATIQSFSLASSMLNNASASSVPAVPHLLLKSLGKTTGGSSSITSKASYNEPVMISAVEGAKGNGCKGTSLAMMMIFSVGVFF